MKDYAMIAVGMARTVLSYIVPLPHAGYRLNAGGKSKDALFERSLMLSSQSGTDNR